MNDRLRMRNAAALLAAAIVLVTASIRLHADTGTCGSASVTLPFIDVPNTNIFFCSIAEAFFSGLSNGTDATHYSPSANVPRDQMAAFITRTMDQSVKRSSRRAALDQFWTTQTFSNVFPLGTNPRLIKSDGSDLWIAVEGANQVQRWQASDFASDGGVWREADHAFGVLIALGFVWVTGFTSPGHLYLIPPYNLAGGGVGTESSSLGAFPAGITFDGQRIWTANIGPPGSVSIVNPVDHTVSTVTTGFNSCYGAIYDGDNVWVTDHGDSKLKKLDSSGNILMSVNVGLGPLYPAFDGTNIWVPNSNSQSVSVVRAKGAFAGTVLATLTTSPPNALNGCQQAAFDGERILVTSFFADSVSLWNASNLTPIGTVSTGTGSGPFGVCSDGVNFFITLYNSGIIVRF